MNETGGRGGKLIYIAGFDINGGGGLSHHGGRGDGGLHLLCTIRCQRIVTESLVPTSAEEKV